MGAKLFAWLGGFALFLGVAFFVKYSFEHNLIPAAVRAAMGYLLALGLIIGGLKIPRAKYAITAQTLAATGIVSLYAVTFACNAIYHFSFFTATPTFLLMALVTTVAFFIAVRLEAQVVAILGILGGFLTPVLLSQHHDNPVGLFVYVALLDVGLVAVALHRRWFYLVPLGAAGTIIMMIGWAVNFYEPRKTTTGMIVGLAFTVLFLLANILSRRFARRSPLVNWTAVALPAVAFCFAAYFMDASDIGSRPALYFGYVWLLSACVILLAWGENIGGLVTGAALVNGLLIVQWAVKVFDPANVSTLVLVTLVFCAIYFAVYLLARRLERATETILMSALIMPVVALGMTFFLMQVPAVGARPGLLFFFIAAADAVLLAIAWLDTRVPKLHLAAGAAAFILLASWMAQNLTDARLAWALGAVLGFAALHAVYPLLLERHHPAARPSRWSQFFPPLALVLILVPLFKLDSTSLLLWPAILLVDVLAIVLAALTASIMAVGVVLVLTLGATGICIFKVPDTTVLSGSLLLIIAAFAVFFFAAGSWLSRRLRDRLPALDSSYAAILGNATSQLPAFSSLLPFLLLIMASARLAVPDPSALFGLGLLLVVLTLGLARIMLIEWLPACAFAGMVALGYAWHGSHFTAEHATTPLAWYLGFYAIFSAYAFVFRRRFADFSGPWAVSALSGVAYFWLVYRSLRLGWPEGWTQALPGLIPAAFTLVPFIGLAVIAKRTPADRPKRLGQLAWFGGVALFFITLIFPIQFERQWLTVAWALEGAALCWLFLRVPHPGLRFVGAALLVTAFVRLSLNHAVFTYHVRSSAPLLNWYLYAYGLTTASLFVGARLLAPASETEPRPERGMLMGIYLPNLFNTLAVILAFLLLNIEIADYFMAPGAQSLAFQFSGNFARDMSYTIAWAVFALALLAGGIWKRAKAARYAAIALLSVTLLKLFFHDLAQLEALYRIGALFGVAVVAILASFAYQRFLPSNEKTPPRAP